MTDQTKLDFQTLLRLDFVNRWQVVCVSRPQSVAEHSWMVMLIAREIAKRAGYAPMVDQVMLDAFWHDAPEVITGDIHTNAKRILGISDGLHKWEEERLAEDQDVRWQSGDLGRKIVKIADLLEARRYLGLYGVGSRATQIRAELGHAALAVSSACPNRIKEAAFSVMEEMEGEVV